MIPNTPLQPGSTNTAAVKQLQDWLVANGYMTQAQVNTGYGTYGPQTTAAVKSVQSALGVDNSTGPGYWGPRTIEKVSAPATGGLSGDAQINDNVARAAALGVTIPGVSGSTTGGTQPKTQDQINADIENLKKIAASHPAVSGNSQAMIDYATSTGDYSQLLNEKGQPFSATDQADALAKGTAAVSPYYQAEQAKETADTESALGSKVADYGKFLDTEATNFQTEKTNQDQTAANNGVLFSGGRYQKLKTLEDTYNKNNTYTKNAYGSDIGDIARNFGYKYGDTAANSLSSYYNLGGNTYNSGVATGGVGSSGLSSIYNANKGFQGTEINAAKSEAQKRAAALLANKGNKLLSTGYTNQQ